MDSPLPTNSNHKTKKQSFTPSSCKRYDRKDAINPSWYSPVPLAIIHTRTPCQKSKIPNAFDASKISVTTRRLKLKESALHNKMPFCFGASDCRTTLKTLWNGSAMLSKENRLVDTCYWDPKGHYQNSFQQLQPQQRDQGLSKWPTVSPSFLLQIAALVQQLCCPHLHIVSVVWTKAGLEPVGLSSHFPLGTVLCRLLSSLLLFSPDNTASTVSRVLIYCLSFTLCSSQFNILLTLMTETRSQSRVAWLKRWS